MEQLKRITIGGKTYPVKMDLNVLEKIQEAYGSINEFERKIRGYEYSKDQDGKQMYDKQGNPIMNIVEPSIKAIKTVLPLIVNEGLEIEAAVMGKEFIPVEGDVLIHECTIPYTLLAEIIYEEFKRCFETKK